jgi:hypothetical protein
MTLSDLIDANGIEAARGKCVRRQDDVHGMVIEPKRPNMPLVIEWSDGLTVHFSATMMHLADFELERFVEEKKYEPSKIVVTVGDVVLVPAAEISFETPPPAIPNAPIN